MFCWWCRRENIPDSLREIYRVAKCGARIYIGEIPLGPGPTPEPEFTTARETLAYLYRKYGLRTCMGMLRRMTYWKLTGQPMIIRAAVRSRSMRNRRNSPSWPSKQGCSS